MNIWQKLQKPIFILAPMEDVTDTVFRQVLLTTGRPALFFTEFTNVDGMFSKGSEHVTKRLKFTTKEKPLIAQIWGMNPENFYKAAKQLGEMGFDGIDLNMGCPQHDVTSHGACSALIKNHALTTEIIKATQEGARSGENGELPVSVKTRIGFGTIQTEDWIGFLLTHNLSALTVHGRTAKEMSKVPAHWDEIGKVVKLRDDVGLETLIIGNGDVMSLAEAEEKVKQYGLDGIMIGRGIFHNAWLFDPAINPEEKSLQDRLTVLQKHVQLYIDTWGATKHYPTLKKYFKIYLSGFDGAAEIRTKFMETNTPEEALQIAKNYLAE
jgi:nifR3 family TIM-barrel protein